MVRHEFRGGFTYDTSHGSHQWYDMRGYLLVVVQPISLRVEGVIRLGLRISGSPINQGLSILVRLMGKWSMKEDHFGKDAFRSLVNLHKSG